MTFLLYVIVSNNLVTISIHMKSNEHLDGNANPQKYNQLNGYANLRTYNEWFGRLGKSIE